MEDARNNALFPPPREEGIGIAKESMTHLRKSRSITIVTQVGSFAPKRPWNKLDRNGLHGDTISRGRAPTDRHKRHRCGVVACLPFDSPRLGRN